MKKTVLKAELFKKLSSNKLQIVVVELKKVFPPSSPVYQELKTLALELSELKMNPKKGVFVKSECKEERNRIKNGLHLLIETVDEEDAVHYVFENEYAVNVKEDGKNSGRKWNAAIGEGLAFLKYTAALIFLAFAFLVNGMDVVDSNISVANCDSKIASIKNELKEYIANDRLVTALKKLEKDLALASKLHTKVIKLESRLERARKNISKKGKFSEENPGHLDYAIRRGLLDIQDVIKCKDLAQE